MNRPIVSQRPSKQTWESLTSRTNAVESIGSGVRVLYHRYLKSKRKVGAVHNNDFQLKRDILTSGHDLLIVKADDRTSLTQSVPHTWRWSILAN